MRVRCPWKIWAFTFIPYSSLKMNLDLRMVLLYTLFFFILHQTSSQMLETMDEPQENSTFEKFLEIFGVGGGKASLLRDTDLEVLLNPGPVFSPDVVFNTLKFQETSKNKNQILPPKSKEKKHHSFNDEHIQLDSEELGSRNPRKEVDYTKINATSGEFTFNFTSDTKILIVSPMYRSRLVMTCDPIDLGNCSSTLDSLLVNSLGDLRFGRNTFIYCGHGAEVRVVSLRRRISLRIRRDEGVEGQMKCMFMARKQRLLEDEDNPCGKIGEARTSKIVGGRRIPPGLFPYLAQLDMTKSSGAHTTCSGSLISNSWVLTAAHCLRGVEAISVYLGGTDRTEFTGDEMLVQAEKFILHKHWNSRTLLGDIALVKLSKPVKYTDEISPVCLPERKLRNENLTGKKGVAAGWGRITTAEKAPRQAYRVKLPFLSDLRCFLSYRRFFKPKVMLCTESTEEKAICYGDSGGPLLYLRNERVYQVGISSYSSSRICGESFDVFTRLDDNYVEWINRRIEEEPSNREK